MKFLCTLLLALLPAIAATSQTPEQALCAVCRVLEGTTTPEKVAASTIYQGQTYYFCAKRCQERFAQDPEAYVPPVLPRPAPSFTVKTLTGEAVTLASFHGRVVLLDFWATWCKPCVRTVPKLQKVHAQFADSGFSVVGIAVNEKGVKPVQSFQQKHKLTYPIFMDDADKPAWETYRVKVIPAMFLIDRQRKIVQQWVNEPDFNEVTAAIHRLVAQPAPRN
ncbi:MAG: redoxin domain-containing protein [candidate division KSB1 bacterium]|nr:redoxin domain-containing protein [candidate division KSB1 bacterium]MDZ7274918.1 redoxin domain-containing protein [candidate division KSB1 bacterium]MDZ7286630.1 redoxin domain-containing protein [candidate division KSB1 bacterium]MDZ7299207.1 redoxin domain-containing protein [candidate division KSB1 bacterium]MDZ7309158.1 redoxin domain-containing protein [candidate division KSB1 bacterium]